MKALNIPTVFPRTSAGMEWKERYASQPELEAYLEHVADKFDLNKDIELNVSVDEMVWMQDQANGK